MHGTPKDNVKRGCVDDEHAQARSAKDAYEIPLVPNNPLAEWV